MASDEVDIVARLRSLMRSLVLWYVRHPDQGPAYARSAGDPTWLAARWANENRATLLALTVDPDNEVADMAARLLHDPLAVACYRASLGLRSV